MFTAKFPLDYPVVAHLQSTALCFHSSVTFVRYLNLPPVTPPSGDLVADVLDADGTSLLCSLGSPWSVTLVEGSGTSRLLQVAFDGEMMGSLISSDAQHPLFLAFLDQAVVRLKLDLGGTTNGEPEMSGDLKEHLSFKLAVVATSSQSAS